MAELVGIDIRQTYVRAVRISASYRKVELEAQSEIDRAEVSSLEQAVQACALPIAQNADAVAVAVDGEVAFVHRLTLPATAEKQLDQVIPFEIEAQVPVEFEELVYDYMLLPKVEGATTLELMTASARLETVRDRIRLVREAIGHEPERVGCGALPLANLATLISELGRPGAVAVADLGDHRTDVVVLSSGRPIFARTLGVGVAGLPESAPRLAAALRQTFVAAGLRAGDPIGSLFLAGAGASAPGAEMYLAAELGVSTSLLPPPQIAGVTPEQVDDLPRFAKALGLAIGLRGTPRDPDLRQGPLNFQRGYAFLKEKAPLLTGLGLTVLVSFFFSAWAELRALGQENEMLASSLSTLTKRALGEEISDPDETLQALERLAGAERDPMPSMDGFDVMVELSKAVPMTIVHDVDELDVQREHVKIRGIVGTTAEAQQIADNLKKHECLSDAKIGKVTQVVNSTRQKYVLEADIKCPSDAPAKKKSKQEAE